MARRPPSAFSRLHPAPVAWLAGTVALAFAGPALAQDGAGRSALTITPTLSVTQTLSDSSRSGSGPEGVTTVSPGVRLSSRSGRVQGTLDYGLTGVLHTRGSGESNFQSRLSAAGRAELVPNHFDISATGSISRQAISLFGPQAADPTLTNENQTQLRSFSVTPSLHGVLGGVVAVQASATASTSNSGSTPGSTATSAALTLSPAAATRLGWSLNATRQVAEFDAGRKTTTDRVVGSLIYTPGPEWRFTVRGGQERTDVASVQQQTYDNYGAGVQWTPGARTSVSLDADQRYFGHSHTFTLQHRLRRSVWRYSDTRDVTNGIGQTGGGGISAYALFFDLFASLEPDPVRRDALVRSFLELNGIPPGAIIGGGFLSSAVTLQRRQELSLALNGRRTSYVLSAYATRSERADTVSTAPDDLAGPVRQRGLTVTASHQLTPRESLNLTALTQRSDADATGRRNTLSSIALGWTRRLSERSNISLNLRHAAYDGDTDPYTENALTAAFATRF